MSDLVIRAERLSKRYHIGVPPKYDNFREAFSAWAIAPWASARGRRTVAARSVDVLWALRDVSFDVRRGEVVGIIGRNGAGKSTLLKVLSRITEPTEGRALIHGRVASLLEVGTGFHPELTGRENIFLNGAILGMRRAEILRQFDAIVEFAEVSRFIDTAVKYYSSGMYLRLAFAVAAHLDPEILIVDEVLAVGDAQFQKKCLGKMDEVARGGRTVLFVSHNMAAVQRLCSRALVLRGGEVVARGEPRAMVAAYLRADQTACYVAARATGEPQVLRAELHNAQDRPASAVLSTEPFSLRIRYTLPKPMPGVRIGVGFLSPDGIPLFTSNPRDVELEVPSAAGEYEAAVHVPGNALLAGEFHVATCLWGLERIYDLQEPALSFEVQAGPSTLYVSDATRKGFVHVPCRWAVQGAASGEPAS